MSPQLRKFRAVPFTEGSLAPGVVLEPQLQGPYEPFGSLPVHSERCSTCLYPDVCAAESTCWNDPEALPQRRPLTTETVWTAESIVEAIQAFARKHDAIPTLPDLPGLGFSRNRAERIFGTWSAAIEAAGFERYRRWGHKRSVNGSQ